MDAEALVTHTWLHTVEECECVVRCEGSDVEVGDSGDHVSQGCQLMEVSCKQTERPNLGGYVSERENTPEY